MQGNKNITILVVVLAVVLAAGLVFAIYRLTEKPGAEKTITVTGSATQRVEPDQARLYLGIDTEADTAEDSQEENAEIAEAIIIALKNAGVSEDDIETDYYYVRPEYDWVDGQRELRGYKTEHIMKITTEDLTKIGALLDLAVEFGANRIDRISFDLTEDKENEIKNQVLAKAIDTAKDKAIVIAENLGVKKIEISSFSESTFHYRPYERYFGMPVPEAKAEIAETPISPEKLEVSANVQIIYNIG